MSEINHPEHYQGDIEVIDVIRQGTEGLTGEQAFNVGNVIKYVMRHTKKNGVEDLKKAAWYLDRAIKNMEDKSGLRVSK